LLQYPNFSKELYTLPDASKQACGAVLTQKKNGLQLPVAYASRSFTKRESNKSITEQERTAIHWAITHFRPCQDRSQTTYVPILHDKSEFQTHANKA